MRLCKRIALIALYLTALAGLGTVALGCAQPLLVRRSRAKKTEPAPAPRTPPDDEPSMSTSGRAG